MKVSNKPIRFVTYLLIILVLGVLFYSDIIRMPIVLVIVLICIAKNSKIAKMAKQQQKQEEHIDIKEIYESDKNVCITSDSQDDFCHTEHHSERMTADAARAELQELKSLLDNGLIEKPEYNQRVAELKSVLK